MIKTVPDPTLMCEGCVYDGILREMKANGLVSISQYKDIYTNSTIYEGTCSIYKNK